MLPVETPSQEAMRHARTLAKLKSRKAMIPHVHKWVDAMKRVLGGNGPQGPMK